jgi:hypothetical protein
MPQFLIAASQFFRRPTPYRCLVRPPLQRFMIADDENALAHLP